MNTSMLKLNRIATVKKPVVFLKEQGLQEGFGTIPSRMLYNVVGGDYMMGSTVTKETMLERGFKVEIVK